MDTGERVKRGRGGLSGNVVDEKKELELEYSRKGLVPGK